MRRWLILLLSVLTLCGCMAASGPQGTPYYLYFRQAQTDIGSGGDTLRTEKRYLTAEETGTPRETAEALMEALLAGPRSEGKERLIPERTRLVGLTIRDGEAHVDLTLPYSQLSGVALAMADYSITLTLTQLQEIASVHITVRGQELTYRSDQCFSREDVLFSSTEDVVGSVQARLYFPNEHGRLVQENRSLDLYEGDTQVRAVLEALEAGPESRDLGPILPEGQYVHALWLEEETCYVNLSSDALKDLPEDWPLSTTLRGLARSLCSLDAVVEVQFLVDGEFDADFGGVPVSVPYGG